MIWFIKCLGVTSSVSVEYQKGKHQDEHNITPGKMKTSLLKGAKL